MCLLGIAALIADVGLYAAASAATSEASDAAIQRQADVIGSGLRISAAGATFNGGPLPTEAADGISTDVAVIDQSGLLTSTPNNPLRPATLENLATPVLRTNRSIWVDLTDANHIQRRVFVTLVAGMDPRTALLVERSVEVQTSSLWITRVLLTILSIAFVALGGLLAYWQAGRVLRPVRDIAGLARSLSERDLHRRVDIAVPDDELGELVRTFNGMLGRLEASFTTMNGFIADASHELRGPLTKMRSEIELAIDRPGSKADLERVLSVVQGETAHLSDLVDKLLLLARADAGVLRPSRRPLDVADFTHEVGSRWLSAAQVSGVRLEVEAPDSGVVMADPTLTRRVLDNLLENAIRHSTPMGTIWLRAIKDGDDWLFEVADQGPGVPLAHRRRIFDRFARVESSRVRGELGGTGLGLAVSTTLARVQEAQLVLVERNGAGAVFQLRFPGSPTANGESRVTPQSFS